MVTYPLNNVEYDAADAELFHCTRTSGIFDGDDFKCTVTGADNSVTVSEGIGWIRNSRFSGKVIALKAAQTLNLGVADSTYPRIDAVAIRFDAIANKTEVVVIPGTPAAVPAPPDVTQTEALYELHICHVRREAGVAAIPVGALTDIRMNEKYCGLMQDDVTPRGAAITEDSLPVVPMKKGGTGATSGQAAMKNLLAAGYMVMSSYQIVNSVSDIPSSAPNGSLFLMPVEE